MKFLIQKINNEIRYDFSFHLLQAIHFKKWLDPTDKIGIKYLNYDPTDIPESDDIYPIPFQNHQKGYCPIGSVEFVTEYLESFYGLTPKPLNVPKELFHYSGRKIFNGTEKDLKGKLFVKSNDKIKSTCGIINEGEVGLTEGNYQFSEVISIDSEWRAFIYRNKLVGLQNYAGEFTLFPNVNTIKGMIETYKSAPIAYTLDIGINDERGTFVIECGDFFAMGLYGFSEYQILPHMFYGWFQEYLRNNLK